MSIIITPETLVAVTLEGSAKSIAKELSNVSTNASACKHAYLANRAGISLEKLAKATSAILAANPASAKKSITKAAMEQRVSAYAFLQDNGLSVHPQTVALAYTLAQKSTKAEEYARIMANFEDPTNKKTLDELIKDAIKRANAAKAAATSAKGADGDEGSEESKADDKVAASIMQDSAGQVTAYIRAQSTRTDFSAKDKTMIAKALAEFAKALAV